ncbi:MAG: hypothetical protein HUJ61_01595 [Bacilli bacterium]|nr:hypothetical protein [Bacilli bacterium]
MEKYKEYDKVITLVEKENIPKGSIGGVVNISNIGTYLVDFVNDDGTIKGLVSYSESEIKLCK